MRYSFTLYELTPDGARVRVRTDNTDQPFDINEGSELELGSTAKLRVLTTYLQIVTELHRTLPARTPAELKSVELPEQDVLSRWALNYLIQHSDRDLAKMLDAALDRTYSASPGEAFFTGGGLHRFHNFRNEDNGRNPTLRDALRESINLPFIRLMRDLVRYTTYSGEDNSARAAQGRQRPAPPGIPGQVRRPRRHRVPAQVLEKVPATKTPRPGSTPSWTACTPPRSAWPPCTVICCPRPARRVSTPSCARTCKASKPRYAQRRAPRTALPRVTAPAPTTCPTKAISPRCIRWTCGCWATCSTILRRPSSDTVKASQFERQEVYSWLFKSRHQSARDSRIRTMLEIEAFLDIHQRWQAVGYPFDHLVPSLATAIGSSGDRPAALAELMGIILNDGVRPPSAAHRHAALRRRDAV